MNKIWWVCLGAVVSLHAAHAATPITATQRDQVIEKLPLITKNRAASQTSTLANPEAAAQAARELITAARQTGDTRYWGRAQAMLFQQGQGKVVVVAVAIIEGDRRRTQCRAA